MRSKVSESYLSTLEAAEAFGVSVSTVKRWVDEGILPAHKTAGGHRKLLRSEVLVLARQGDLPRGDVSALSGLVPRNQTINFHSLGEALYQSLLAGQSEETNALICNAYHAGASIELLADGLIAPLMARVGHEWQNTRLEIWQEHRITQLLMSALFKLKGELESRAEKNRPIAVGGAPAGDLYLLPTTLAQLVLMDAGWETVQLGPNTPIPSLIHALHAIHPRLIWLSVSHLEDEAVFVSSYRDLYREADEEGVAVAIGGRALVQAIRSGIPYTMFGDNFSHLGAFARTLHPRPKPPRRGRPRK